MITIPQPIKYERSIHFPDLITLPLDPKNDLNFIRKVLIDLERDHAEVYIVRNDNGKIAVCRKGLKPVKVKHAELHNYFALKNSSGRIISNGKNLRRTESMISVLKGMFRRNPIKLDLLKRNYDLTTAEKCELFNYTLCKQNEPF